jgi:hypothetical protein
MEIDFEFHTALDGTITVTVVPPNGNSLVVSGGTPPAERDALIVAFMEEQRALAGGEG